MRLRWLHWPAPFYLRVVATEVFGPDAERVNVLRFQPTTELWAMRRFVEEWNKSEYPFSPHATIGPAGIGPAIDRVPDVVGFNRVYVAWGEENLTFNLTNGPSSGY
jgi:hypothetical protein